MLIYFQDTIIQIFHSARHLIHLNLLHTFRNIYQQWIQPKLPGITLQQKPELEGRLNIKVAVIKVPACYGWNRRQSPAFKSEGLGFCSPSPFNDRVTVTLGKIFDLGESLTSHLKVELLGLLNLTVRSMEVELFWWR